MSPLFRGLRGVGGVGADVADDLARVEGDSGDGDGGLDEDFVGDFDFHADGVFAGAESEFVGFVEFFDAVATEFDVVVVFHLGVSHIERKLFGRFAKLAQNAFFLASDLLAGQAGKTLDFAFGEVGVQRVPGGLVLSAEEPCAEGDVGFAGGWCGSVDQGDGSSHT